MSSNSSRVSKGRAKPPLELARLGYSYAAAPGQASSAHNCNNTTEDDESPHAWPADENCGRRQDSLWTERPRRLEAGQNRASASLATAKPLAPLAHSRIAFAHSRSGASASCGFKAANGGGQVDEIAGSFFRDGTLGILDTAIVGAAEARNQSSEGALDEKGAAEFLAVEEERDGDLELQGGDAGTVRNIARSIRCVQVVYDAGTRKHILVSREATGVQCPLCHHGKMTACDKHARAVELCEPCYVCGRALGAGKHFACGSCSHVEICYTCNLSLASGRSTVARRDWCESFARR